MGLSHNVGDTYPLVLVLVLILAQQDKRQWQRAHVFEIFVLEYILEMNRLWSLLI